MELFNIAPKRDGNEYMYFVVFTLDLSPGNKKAREIATRKDIYDKSFRPDIPFIEPFKTKIGMKIWVDENYEAFKTVYLLKQIS